MPQPPQRDRAAARNEIPQPGATETSPGLPSVVPALSSARRDLRILRRCVLTLLVIVGVGIAYLAQELLIPVLVAILFALLLSPIVGLLERMRLARGVGSALVLAAMIALFVGGIVSLAQPARDWLAHAPETIKTIQHRLEDFRLPLREAREATKRIEDLTQSGQSSPTVVATQPSLLSAVAASTPRALASIAAVFILMYFFLAGGDSFLRRLVEVAPRLSEKKMVVSIARDVQGEISRYLVTVSAINLCLGIATGVAMYSVGLPTPMLWGAAVAVLNFAPYVGPASSAFALLVAGFTTFDSLGHALLPPGIFLCFTFLEGQLITPTIIGKRFELDPTIVFIWLLLWGWLWGIVGVLVAGPLLACFRIVCQHVDSLHAVSVLIGSGAEPHKP